MLWGGLGLGWLAAAFALPPELLDQAVTGLAGAWAERD
ncbi:hypothetical protein FHR33_001212 [Nonomuraea dietziae]|uniref:Uncharacterized protein n=1 Tax=Nonomuraea dietziae TaxID=65515 RepID=A0A7W5UVE5_9ACTN|nr:hypothetical protein [Nonomuraea dietziae]